jgi:ribulose-bisphosphate carboxylase large chain
MNDERVLATYLIETPHSLEHAATVIAGEQSSGTFVAVPGETQELKERFGAQVVGVEPLEVVDTPSLPGSKPPKSAAGKPRYQRGIIRISFPLHNFGPNLPALMSTVAGNLYELQEVSGLRLLDLDLPEAFARRYAGPAFGVDGTRCMAQVHGRALIGTIVKPSIGLTLEQLRPLVRDLALAGLDFVKDDEIHADPPYAPFSQRVDAVMDELDRAADVTGRKAMYAFNLTGDIDHMLYAHDYVLRRGGTCVMVNINLVGIAGVVHLRRHAQLPIHGHRAYYGAMARDPLLGVDFTAYQKICRLAGVDHLHVSGFDSKFYQTNEEVVRSIRDCLTPLFGGYQVVPVLSSAQWAGSAIDTYRETGTCDVLHLAGGGIIAHPAGIGAGVRAMQMGWEAAMAGVPLGEYAKTRPELQAAIDKFGRRG